jgi:hypothetical protein
MCIEVDELQRREESVDCGVVPRRIAALVRSVSQLRQRYRRDADIGTVPTKSRKGNLRLPPNHKDADVRVK